MLTFTPTYLPSFEIPYASHACAMVHCTNNTIKRNVQ